MKATRNQPTRLDPKERAKQLQQDSPTDCQTPTDIALSLTAAPDQFEPFPTIVLNWTIGEAPGYYDYVALFDKDPQVVTAQGYLFDQWEWVYNHLSPYQTDTAAGTGEAYWIAYCSWDCTAKEYFVVTQSGPTEVSAPA